MLSKPSSAFSFYCHEHRRPSRLLPPQYRLAVVGGAEVPEHGSRHGLRPPRVPRQSLWKWFNLTPGFTEAPVPTHFPTGSGFFVFRLRTRSFPSLSLRKRRFSIRDRGTLCPIGSCRSQPAARVRQGPVYGADRSAPAPLPAVIEDGRRRSLPTPSDLSRGSISEASTAGPPNNGRSSPEQGPEQRKDNNHDRCCPRDRLARGVGSRVDDT